MTAIKIRCPKCGRVMGDTNESLDCNLNCRGCRETSHIKMIVVRAADYLKDLTNKEEITDGKSK